MVSDFRRKKLLHVFHVFFDTDKSGVVEQKDFEISIDKIAEIRGWKEGDHIYEQAKKTSIVMWEGLQRQADKDDDNQVTAEEWIQLWEDFAKDPEDAALWQILYCRFIFQMQDASSDGSIDSEEFSAVLSSLGLDKDQCVEAFAKMAGGKDEVSWDEFQELWKEYFSTEDPEAPGNFIFGFVA